jgi:hypothetical protein
MVLRQRRRSEDFKTATASNVSLHSKSRRTKNRKMTFKIDDVAKNVVKQRRRRRFDVNDAENRRADVRPKRIRFENVSGDASQIYNGNPVGGCSNEKLQEMIL